MLFCTSRKRERRTNDAIVKIVRFIYSYSLRTGSVSDGQMIQLVKIVLFIYSYSLRDGGVSDRQMM